MRPEAEHRFSSRQLWADDDDDEEMTEISRVMGHLVLTKIVPRASCPQKCVWQFHPNQFYRTGQMSPIKK